MSMPYRPAVCRSFIAHLKAVAPPGSYFGLALKLLTPPDDHGRITRIGRARWTRTPATEVEHLLWHVDQAQADADYLLSFRSLATAAQHILDQRPALEVVMRLGVCATPPVYDDGSHRGGRLQDYSAVLGLMLDVDLARPDDERHYPPDADEALGVIEDYAPSFVLRCGPGLPVGWLFTAPVDPDEADQLGHDLRHEVGQRFDALGYAFDSPSPTTAWCRVPGTWSVRRQALVTAVQIGERIAADDLRALVPVGPQRANYGGFYPDPDDPWGELHVGLGSREVPGQDRHGITFR